MQSSIQSRLQQHGKQEISDENLRKERHPGSTSVAAVTQVLNVREEKYPDGAPAEAGSGGAVCSGSHGSFSGKRSENDEWILSMASNQLRENPCDLHQEAASSYSAGMRRAS